MENMHCLSSSYKLKSLSRIILIFLIPILFLSCSAVETPTLRSSVVPLLNPLNDWLYRGPQPAEKDFVQLKRKGIRTVVNFRHEPKWIEWEKEKVEALGMKYVSLPWSITKPVKPQLLDQFFEVLDDPKNRPVFFHCRHGRDRSGVMATLAFMRYEKLSESQAREIALETIRPHLRYRSFVNQKINFFVKHLHETSAKEGNAQ